MRRRRPGWPLLLALAWLAGCSQTTMTEPVWPPGEPVEDSGLEAAQTLYRVRYEGPAGAGSLRLVLRQLAADRFQLRAADTFGRAVWSLEMEATEVQLVNHRERFTCLAGAELRVPELALRPLPLTAVPRVLRGLLPVPPPAGVADESDWTERSGQRWTVRREQGELRGWTLWQQGEPRLWWLAQPSGGILSHRDGSQFRWRQVGREELSPATYRRLEAPPEYPVEPCQPAAGLDAGGDAGGHV